MSDTKPLCLIAGLSPFNARRNAPPSPEEIEEMASSILEHGIIDPLLLRIEDQAYRVLDGGRRYFALRQLAESGRIEWDHPVPCLFFEGADEQALEVSMISFLHRKDLHPVDEFERFAELRDAFGLDETSIARKTGKSLRFVKERLRLARLAPAIRAAWRDGKIIAEQAKAFATNPRHEEQCEVYERLCAEFGGDLAGDAAVDRDMITEELCGAAVRETNALARFVGAEAYEAAGGELDRQLLEGESWFLDGALLRRLAEQQLEALGEEIKTAEGWGWVCYDHLDGHKWQDGVGGIEAGEGEYTDEELERLEELEKLPPAERAVFEDEIDQIDTRAQLRSISADDRSGLGAYLALDIRGRVEVIRGISFKEPTAPAGGEREDEEPEEQPAPFSRARNGEITRRKEKEASAPSLPSSEEMRANARGALDKAMNAALREVVQQSDALAMVIAVAALTRSYGGVTVNLGVAHWGRHEDCSALGREINGLGFDKALHRTCRAHGDDPHDVFIVFAESIAQAIDVARTATFDEPIALLTVAASMSDVAGALRRALDYAAFFKAETKETALAAIGEIDGEAAQREAAKLKKPVIAERAALLAKDKGWLPEPLRSAVAAPLKDTRSTAAAMLDALDSDFAAKAAKGKRKGRKAKSDADSGQAEAAAEHSAGASAALTEAAAQDAAPANDAAGDLSALPQPGAEDAQAEEARDVDGDRFAAIDYSDPLFARFLRDHVDWSDELAVKAASLRDAYKNMLATAHPHYPAPIAAQIGALLKKIGVAKETRPDGTYYLGLAPKAAQTREAAE
jgi:ParB family chromosome partitioning protein